MKGWTHLLMDDCPRATAEDLGAACRALLREESDLSYAKLYRAVVGQTSRRLAEEESQRAVKKKPDHARNLREVRRILEELSRPGPGAQGGNNG